MKDLLQKLNWRFILIHSVAVCLFMYGMRQFFLITTVDNINFLVAHSENSRYMAENSLTNQNMPQQLFKAILWPHYFMFAGMLLANLVSFIISKRKKTFWLNSFCVLIISFIMVRGPVSDSYFVKHILTGIGFCFDKCGLEYVFAINGIILTSLAFFFMFSRWSNRFIFRQ